MAEGARLSGWTSAEVPMSDGGEGLLDVIGGALRTTVVPGPLGQSVAAEWRLSPGHSDEGPIAIIEMSRAAGRGLMPHPHGDDPVRADTAGVGHSSPGGAGRRGTPHRGRVWRFGHLPTAGGESSVRSARPRPSPGSNSPWPATSPRRFVTPRGSSAPKRAPRVTQIDQLSDRLGALADRYRRDFGVDVDAIPGAGGGRRAGRGVGRARRPPGPRIRPGGGAGRSGRPAGRGRCGRHRGRAPRPPFVPRQGARWCPRPGDARCCVSAAGRPGAARPPPGMEVISLTERFGRARARAETTALIAEVTAEFTARFAPDLTHRQCCCRAAWPYSPPAGASRSARHSRKR